MNPASFESKPPIGVYPTTTVRDVAESLYLDKLSEETCRAVSGDVEYRLNLIMQEAAKFMRHAKRMTLLPADIDYALKALNVQPTLQPAHPLYKPNFAAVFAPNEISSSSQQQLYYLKDEEIDLAQYLKGSHAIPAAVARKSVEGKEAGVRWKAHWLAVEGVQPLIPENPISQIAETSANGAAAHIDGDISASRPVNVAGVATINNKAANQKMLAKAHLSQEMQLLFTRITECLVPNPSLTSVILDESSASSAGTPKHHAPSSSSKLSSSETARQGALATLSNDPSLAELLPYLIRWLTNNVSNALTPRSEKGKEVSRTTTEVSYLLDGINALLTNEHLFIEPYLHQILPAILSVLLVDHLSSSSSSSSVSTSEPTAPPAPSLRQTKEVASGLLTTLLQNFAREYDSLVPRIARVLTRTFMEPAPPGSARSSTSENSGRYLGALLGFRALGNQAVKSAFLGDDGELLRFIGEKAKVGTDGLQGQQQQEGRGKELIDLALDILADALGFSKNEAAIQQDTAMNEDVSMSMDETTDEEDELVEKVGEALARELRNPSRLRLRVAIMNEMMGKEKEMKKEKEKEEET